MLSRITSSWVHLEPPTTCSFSCVIPAGRVRRLAVKCHTDLSFLSPSLIFVCSPPGRKSDQGRSTQPSWLDCLHNRLQRSSRKGEVSRVCGWLCKQFIRSLSFLANMRRWPNVGLLLAYRLRRWPNRKPTLGQRLMFAGE